MGYAVYEDRDARDRGVERWAGYGVPGVCDHPDCEEPLPFGRGMGSKCERRYTEDEETGDEIETDGCGLYFCGAHLEFSCPSDHDAISPKPDSAEWERWILTDESWAEWRAENPERTSAMRMRHGDKEATR